MRLSTLTFSERTCVPATDEPLGMVGMVGLTWAGASLGSDTDF